MTYITSNQGRPIQGVSQQPAKTRLPGQCTISDNLRPDVVRGLINRQGTEQLAILENALLSADSKWYYYDRGTGESYFISIEKTTGKVRAWSKDGTEHIINVQDNTEAGYLASSQPKKDLVMTTIGDYTFISNNKTVVEESASLTPAISYTSLIYVQFMDYSQTIEVIVDDVVVATYTSPDGETATDLAKVNPTYVIANLIADMVISLPTGYTYVADGNTIVFNKTNGTDYDIEVDDGFDNNNAVAIKGKIKNTALLPGRAPEGFLVEVDPPGSTKEENSSYYLEAVNTGSDHITWQESIAPSISVGTKLSSMPHVLVRESISLGVATFTLREGEWSEREVGSDNTNPLPTFVGEFINSIGIFQNRMFFTAAESVVMSRTSDFFNFFRETTQASLDTDPIDVFPDTAEVNFLISSLVFDGDLVFFSKQGQFIVDGSKPITSANAVLRQTTSFEAQLDVKPVASGDSVMFAFSYGIFTGIREFFTDSITDTKKARPVTDHVKQYLSGSPTIMKASTNLNLLLTKTDGADNILYAYDWLWQGTEKVQSSWGKWIFPEGDNILHYEFTDEVLELIIMRDGAEIYVESIDLGDPVDATTNYQIRLDRKTDGIMIWDEPTLLWRMTDPLPLIPIEDLIAVRKEGAYEEEIGTAIDVGRDGTELVTEEDLGTGNVTVCIGRRYNCVYSPTNPVALDQNGLALSLDKLTIGGFYMNYNTSGDITATVALVNGNERVAELSNRTLGGPENLIGFAPLVEGQHRVSIRQKSDKYTLTYNTWSHLPLEVRDFEYNGNLNRRGRRI